MSELTTRVKAPPRPGKRAAVLQGDVLPAGALRAMHRRFRSEGDFQREVIRLAKFHGWAVWHDYDPRRNAAGLPDLILMRDRVLWRELKSEHGKVQAEQLLFITGLRAAGQDAKVWRPSDFEEIERTLV